MCIDDHFHVSIQAFISPHFTTFHQIILRYEKSDVRVSSVILGTDVSTFPLWTLEKPLVLEVFGSLNRFDGPKSVWYW